MSAKLTLPCHVVRNLTDNDWRCLTCNTTLGGPLGFMSQCPELKVPVSPSGKERGE